MRISARLLTNASTTYLRMGATFALGLFSTWYAIGKVGVTGFGLIALAVSTTGLSHAIERTLRFGLVRELASALASGDRDAVARNLASAVRLCRQAVAPLLAVASVLALLAWLGFFNTPTGERRLDIALAALMLGEGLHAAVRLLTAPYIQALFASQRVALDNALIVVARATNALSMVLVFGWLLPDASLATQLMGFAVSRVTLQLADVALGTWLARASVPALRHDRAAFDRAEFLQIRHTVSNSAQVALLVNITPQILAVVINLFFGLAYNTIWQVAIQFAGFAWMLSEGLLRGIAPLTTHLEHQGRGRAAVDLMARSIRYQLSAALPAALLLGIFSRPLLELWVGKRLALDASLSAAGLDVSQALDLAATMSIVLLVAFSVRAAFFGVERILYGMGHVRAYAWFSKWATLGAVAACAAVLAAWPQPVVVPLAALGALGTYSTVAVLGAARRETGLAIGAALRRSLPRPLLAAAVLAGALLAASAPLDPLTPVRVVGLLAGAAALYTAIALAVIPEVDERPRIAEALRSLVRSTPPR